MSNLNAALPEYTIERMKKSGLFFEDDLINSNLPTDVIGMVTDTIAAEFQVVPLCKDGNRLVLATSTEQTLKESSRLMNLLHCKDIKLLLADEDNVKMALVKYYKMDLQRQHMYRGKATSAADADTTPLKRKIDTIIQDAIQKNASDIHLRPTENGMCIEFRINGRLVDFSTDYNIGYNEIVNAVNILKGKDKTGNANISQAIMPNSGGFTVLQGNTLIHVRLSTMPLASTEERLQKVNLRLLPQREQTKKLDDLGYSPEDLKAIRTALLRSATGLFLITGETGSGKTTSLYAQIEEVLTARQESLNVITIENPVEIHDSRYCQVQVRETERESEKLSLTAPKILEVALRQDPDIILYGEIRNKLDAEVAVQAAETGHKVFSTLHSRNGVTSISRLLDLGVSRISLLSSINMIIAQKLVGRLCPHCSKSHQLTEREKLVLSPEEIKILSKAPLREPGDEYEVKQCSHCDYGYIGRTVIAEYILFDLALRDAFLKADLSFSEIAAILKKREFRSMWDKALDMVKVGETDLMEIIKKIGKDG